MIYIQRDSTVYGPYSEGEAYEHFKTGQLLQNDLASTDGTSDWKPLLEVLFSERKATEPAAPTISPISAPIQENGPRRNWKKRCAWGVLSVLVVAVLYLPISHHQQRKANEQFRQNVRALLRSIEEPKKRFEAVASAIKEVRHRAARTKDGNITLLAQLRDSMNGSDYRQAARDNFTASETLKKEVDALLASRPKNCQVLSYKLMKASNSFQNFIFIAYNDPISLADYSESVRLCFGYYEGSIENLKLSLDAPQTVPGMFDFLTEHLPGKSESALSKLFHNGMREYKKCIMHEDDDESPLGRGNKVECEFTFYPDGTVLRHGYVTLGDTETQDIYGCGRYSIEGRTLKMEGTDPYTMEIEGDGDLLLKGQRLKLKDTRAY